MGNGNHASPSRKPRRRSALPLTEQAIKWMHSVCGYPVKSTWLKAIQAGNYIGWPLLTAQKVKKYYPETIETPKGHMNQTRKDVRSAKPKPLENCDTSTLHGKKVRDIYNKVYDVRNTIFQTKQAIPKALPMRQQVYHGDGRI